MPPTTGEILERAITADPDDQAAHAAYADWLSQQGDPRGEFIQVQLALEDPSRPLAERKKLQKREKKMLQENGRQWLGGLADCLLDPDEDFQFQFARGWLDNLSVPFSSSAFLHALVKAPETRLLRRLQIEREFEDSAADDIDTNHSSLHVLAASKFLGNLRVFYLGEPVTGEYSRCSTSGASAADLVARMPRLEELYLLAHRVDMEKLFRLKNLNHLRILQIYHCHRYPLELLARNAAFANLKHLLLHPHALELNDEYNGGAYVNLKGVRAVLHSSHLKKLTHLQCRLSDLGDPGCAELVRSGILGRLKMLDLMHGCITDRGAHTLAACPELKNLELLEISYNRLTTEGIRALQATGIKVHAANQYGPDSDNIEYLWLGDMGDMDDGDME